VGTTDITIATGEQLEDASTAAKDNYLDVAFLAAADKVRCGKLLEDTENDHTKCSHNYHTMVTSAYTIVLNFKNYKKPAARLISDYDGIYFANVEKKQVDQVKVICYGCGDLGI
jgi:hypothetical protein